MIYVFLGSDFNILNDSVNALIKDLNISNIIKYDFNESSIIDIIDEVNYVDLFNEKKLIIVSNFSLKKIKENDEKIFMRYIENMNDNIIIFKCIDESLDERKSLTKLLRSKCDIRDIKKLDYKGLHEYITNMFKDNNIIASYDQIKRILDLCDYNPDFTINEVNKLLLYKIGDNKLLDKDIDDVISKNTEKEMFKFIESVMEKNIASSMKSYKVLISCNIDVIVIIDSLAKQFRLLLQVKELRSEKSELELSRLLGVNPYTIKKLYPFLNKYSVKDIIDILHKLSAADIDIKVNGFDKNDVIEKFLINI